MRSLSKVNIFLLSVLALTSVSVIAIHPDDSHDHQYEIETFKNLNRQLQEMLIESWKKAEGIKRAISLKQAENAENASKIQLQNFVKDAKRDISINKLKSELV